MLGINPILKVTFVWGSVVVKVIVYDDVFVVYDCYLVCVYTALLLVEDIWYLAVSGMR